MHSSKLKFFASPVLGILFATALSAQTLTITPGSLKGGVATTINYSDPARAGDDIVVEISGGFPLPTVEKVTIRLDAAGNGQASWVPNGNWMTAAFSAPGVAEQVLNINA